MINMTDDFDAERSQLMNEGNRLRAQAYKHDDAGRMSKSAPLWTRIDAIARRYRELLPEVPVARCPDSGELVRWPMDTAGLDGWFWEYDSPTSRGPGCVPRTWLAMTGAMRLAAPVESTPHLVRPGPAVPFVLPRILDNPGIRAVLAEVPVGAHTGWAISYFGPMPNVKLVDRWGTDSYPVYRDGVRTGWDADSPAISECDFELTAWLRSGSLLWIAPGDKSATLREGPEGCPFADLRGKRRFAFVLNGEVQYGPTSTNRITG